MLISSPSQRMSAFSFLKVVVESWSVLTNSILREVTAPIFSGLHNLRDTGGSRVDSIFDEGEDCLAYGEREGEEGDVTNRGIVNILAASNVVASVAPTARFPAAMKPAASTVCWARAVNRYA